MDYPDVGAMGMMKGLMPQFLGILQKAPRGGNVNGGPPGVGPDVNPPPSPIQADGGGAMLPHPFDPTINPIPARPPVTSIGGGEKGLFSGGSPAPQAGYRRNRYQSSL